MLLGPIAIDSLMNTIYVETKQSSLNGLASKADIELGFALVFIIVDINSQYIPAQHTKLKARSWHGS